MERIAVALLVSFLATAAMAQFPTLRILPESPRTNHRVYLEVGITPCRVVTSDVISQGPTVRVANLVTGDCQGPLPAVGSFVMLLGSFPQGGTRVGVSVDGVHRVLTFEVGGAPDNIAFSDSGAPVVGSERRADHSLEVAGDCLRDLVTLANDARTEIVVDRRMPRPPRICPATPPAQPPVRIGFPTPGQHLAILEYGGEVIATELITVTAGFAKLDYSDLWGVEGESGWGATLSQHDLNRVFLVLYAYRADQRPLWLSMAGPDWETGTRFSGPLLVSSGTTQVGAYDATQSGSRSVGNAVVEFASADAAVLTIQGFSERESLGLPAQRSWNLRRIRF